MCSVWWGVVTREATRVQTWTLLLLVSCVALGTLLILSVLQFPPLWMVLEDLLPPAAYPASALPDIGANSLWTVSFYDIWAHWSDFIWKSECVMEGSELGWLLVSLWWSSSVCADSLLLARRPKTMFERCLKSTTMDVISFIWEMGWILKI